jgi:hypothetical protein
MMSSTEQSVTVLRSFVERAAKLAPVITADPNATNLNEDDGKWTPQDVINVALSRGLDALEQQYLGQGR